MVNVEEMSQRSWGARRSGEILISEPLSLIIEKKRLKKNFGIPTDHYNPERRIVNHEFHLFLMYRFAVAKNRRYREKSHPPTAWEQMATGKPNTHRGFGSHCKPDVRMLWTTAKDERSQHYENFQDQQLPE